MRKTYKVLLAALAVMAIAATAVIFAGCGEKKEEAKLQGSYIVGDMKDNSYSGKNYVVYQLNLYDDQTYEYIFTENIYGYSMLMGTTVIINSGTYTKGAAEDGFTAVTLSDATQVIFNSYSKAGGYNISIDTKTTDFSTPVELLATGEGEKVYANSAQDVINAYGKGLTVYTSDTKNEFSLTNPNA